MTSYYLSIVIATIFLSFISFLVNGAVAFFGPIHLKVRSASIATLSIVYFGSNLWIVFNQQHTRTWASFMAGASLLPWLIVWIWPAVARLVFDKQIHETVQSLKRQVGDGEDS